MNYTYYTSAEHPTYRVCILVPVVRKEEIYRTYLKDTNLNQNDVMVIGLHYSQTAKKTPMVEMRAFISEELVPIFEELKVEMIIVADGEYFKAFTKAPKIEANLGYVLDTHFGSQKVVYVPSTAQIFYDPDKTKAKIQTGIQAAVDFMDGCYKPPGNSIIVRESYPMTDEGIEDALEQLLNYGQPLTCDIEGFGLKHYTCGIGSITFCWNQGEGMAFPVDYEPTNPTHPLTSDLSGFYGKQVRNEPRRALLRRFFERCHSQGIRLIYHSINFDVTMLIYQLFMDHILDQEGLLYGLKVMLGDSGNWDCTKLITYLATNSCAGNKLGLKDQAQEFAGNYAMDPEAIKDIRKIPLPVLLQYNLVDGLSTWFVHDKHKPTMIEDQQLPVYENLFQPAMVDIIQMQLTGMPVNMKTVFKVEKELNTEQDRALVELLSTQVVQKYNYVRLESHTRKMNAEWKTKRLTVDQMAAHALVHEPTREAITFNPNSAPQLQELLFEIIGLPVVGHTESGQPSADGDAIKALQNHTKDPDVLKFLKGLEDYKAVNKIITDFIPSLKGAQLGPDGWHYLFGNFNLGGTKSGRLSSSGPNLQNLPASSRYAKKIKECFEAPPGWLFCGLDFASLEDKISALTSKDPNKLKVYTDGYDGHSLRAYAYFGDKMPDIDPNSVVSINSIQKKYKPERGESKAPTFALTYQGTWSTLVKNCGFSEEKARMVETKYHELYVVSDEWVAGKLLDASNLGYVTLAFGLRLRTPLLHQVVLGNSKTPHQAKSEGRTAGNALGQSYCLLNTRAGIEFNPKVRAHPVFRLMIKPSAHIHDAQYFLIKDDLEAIMFTNEHLVKSVQWQEAPEIAHDEVKLGGEFGIFWPTWNTEIVIPNGATRAEAIAIVEEAMA